MFRQISRLRRPKDFGAVILFSLGLAVFGVTWLIGPWTHPWAWLLMVVSVAIVVQGFTDLTMSVKKYD